MLRFLFIFSIVFAFRLTTYAQLRGQALVDSLFRELTKAKEDTNKVNLLNQISEEVVSAFGDYDTSLYYARTAMPLAEKLKFKKGVAAALTNTGVVWCHKGNYPEAIKNNRAALKINSAINYKNGIARNYKELGNIYGYQGNNSEALKFYSAALKICKAIGDKGQIAKISYNIGNSYTALGNYPEALKHLYTTLHIDEAAGNHIETAQDYTALGNIYGYLGNNSEALKFYSAALKICKAVGNIEEVAVNYNNIGNMLLKDGKYTEALVNLYASQKIADTMEHKVLRAHVQLNIGVVKLLQEKYEEALKEFLGALKIYETLGENELLAKLYINIGTAYFALGKQHIAKSWMIKGANRAKELGLKLDAKNSHFGLARVDSALGDFKGAYEHYKLYMLYRDSLNNEEISNKNLQTKMQYEFDKKESLAKAQQEKKNSIAKLKLQKQQTYTYIGSGVAVLMLGFSVFIFRGSKKLAHEKKRSEGLLLNILPSEIADELKDRGATTAKHYDEVTVLFTDFVNFTGAGEKMGTQKLVEELHTCFKTFDEIISKHNIEKIKTIGDAYLAVSGLPVPDSQHAHNVVNAAMEIRAFMLSRKQQLSTDTFEIRIGIHSGPVVAGIVGVKKFAYDIWGDTVNTAARMEQKSEAGKINISHTTYELVKDTYTCTYRGEIEAKNKGMLKMYFVEGIA